MQESLHRCASGDGTHPQPRAEHRVDTCVCVCVQMHAQVCWMHPKLRTGTCTPPSPPSPSSAPFPRGFTCTLELAAPPALGTLGWGFCWGIADSTLEIKVPTGSGRVPALLGGPEDEGEGCVWLSGCAKSEEVLPLGMSHAALAVQGLFCSPSLLTPPKPLSPVSLSGCFMAPGLFYIFLPPYLYGSAVLPLLAALASERNRGDALQDRSLNPSRSAPNRGNQTLGAQSPMGGRVTLALPTPNSSHPHLFPSPDFPVFLFPGLMEADPPSLCSIPPRATSPSPEGPTRCPPPLPVGHQPYLHPFSRKRNGANGLWMGRKAPAPQASALELMGRESPHG